MYLVFVGKIIANNEDVTELYKQLKRISCKLPEQCIPIYIKKFHAQGKVGNSLSKTYDDQKRAARWWDQQILDDRG